MCPENRTLGTSVVKISKLIIMFWITTNSHKPLFSYIMILLKTLLMQSHRTFSTNHVAVLFTCFLHILFCLEDIGRRLGRPIIVRGFPVLVAFLLRTPRSCRGDSFPAFVKRYRCQVCCTVKSMQNMKMGHHHFFDLVAILYFSTF